MNMLLSNWKDVLISAWSVKLMGFAAFLEIAGEVVPYLGELLPWWASCLVILFAMLARHLKQPNMPEAADVDS